MTQQRIDYDGLFAFGLAEVLARKRAEQGDLPPDTEQAIVNQYTREFAAWRATHLERRLCTKDAPMRMEDKDAYQWGHPDAEEVNPPMRYANAWIYRCPHCDLTFHARPKDH